MACGRQISRSVLLLVKDEKFGDEIQLEDLKDTMVCSDLITVVNPDNGQKFSLPVRAILHGRISKVLDKVNGE